MAVLLGRIWFTARAPLKHCISHLVDFFSFKLFVWRASFKWLLSKKFEL